MSSTKALTYNLKRKPWNKQLIFNYCVYKTHLLLYIKDTCIVWTNYFSDLTVQWNSLRIWIQIQYKIQHKWLVLHAILDCIIVFKCILFWFKKMTKFVYKNLSFFYGRQTSVVYMIYFSWIRGYMLTSVSCLTNSKSEHDLLVLFM